LPDRLLAVVLVALAAGAIWHAWSLVVPFAADPVGPSAFPIAIALLLGISAVLIGLRPTTVWPMAEKRLPGPVAVLAMLAYALLLQPLGFIIATALLCIAIAMAFGGGWWRALLVGAVTAPALWLLLDQLLDLPLPSGPLGF
jgi:putative tricarboxylic transport membrane protein